MSNLDNTLRNFVNPCKLPVAGNLQRFLFCMHSTQSGDCNRHVIYFFIILFFPFERAH